MKKIIILLFALVAFATASEGQVVASTADTLTNTDTANIVKMTNQDAFVCYSMQAVVNKISGTLAGTVQLEGSNDGTNYVETGDSLTLVDGAVFSGLINISTKQYKYFRAKVYQSGTVVAEIRIYWYYKNN